jgi:RNA polymerase sigma factor (sigma-70 family)
MNVEQMVVDNKGLIISIAQKYYSKNRHYSIEDLTQIGYMSLISNISKYDKDRGKLSTFITVCVKNDILKFINQFNQENKNISIYFVPENKISYTEDHFELEHVPQKNHVQQIVKMKKDGYTISDIADQMDIKISIVKKILRNIRRNIEQ